jgi:hypothetical protein
MVASVESLEVQIVWGQLVMSSVVPSESVPVALNCCVRPGDRVVDWGLTTTRRIRAPSQMERIVTIALALIPLATSVATMVAVPEPWPITSPVVSTVATYTLDDLHAAVDEMSPVAPSQKVASAWSLRASPEYKTLFTGATESAVTWGQCVGGPGQVTTRPPAPHPHVLM